MLIQVVLILTLLVLVIICVYVHFKRQRSQELKGYQVNTKFDTNQESGRFYEPFDKLVTYVPKFKDANFIMFTDYADIDNNIEMIYNQNKKAHMYAIHGSDLMASKSNLARFFQKTGNDQYIPFTLILDEPTIIDVSTLQKNKPYILKQNVQRQQGNTITRDIEFIKKAQKEGYVVCQELLQDPFILNKRKVNMRIYMLVTCMNNRLNFYIYNNGFMYYTPKYFEKDSDDKDVNITTGYIDRQVYKENPLTLKDFNAYLGEEKGLKLQNNLVSFFKTFKNIYNNPLQDLNSKGKRFNVFGVDIAPDEALNVKIMEVNKAPDLSFKDERDGEVKLNLVKDMFTLVGLNPGGNPDNFIMV